MGGTELDLTAGPAWFGAGSVRRLPDVVAATGAGLAVVITDAGLVATGLADWVTELLDGAGLTVTVFDGVHANPTTGDLAAGADTVRSALDQAALDQPASPAVACLVAVGGGSPIEIGRASCRERV